MMRKKLIEATTMASDSQENKSGTQKHIKHALIAPINAAYQQLINICFMEATLQQQKQRGQHQHLPHHQLKVSFEELLGILQQWEFRVGLASALFEFIGNY